MHNAIFCSKIGPLDHELWASKVGVLQQIFSFFWRADWQIPTEAISAKGDPIWTKFGTCDNSTTDIQAT